MTLWTTIGVAVRALRRNAMRTSLTALGMVIGVAAVIVMVALGQGARSSIEGQIRSAGSNLVIVTAGSGGFGPVRQGQGATTTLTPADAAAIRREVSGIRAMSPGINTRVQIVAEGGNWNTQVQGAGEELAAIRSWPLQFGSFFGEADVTRAAKVAVLGSVTRDQLFGPGADPVGETIRIRNQPFKVLGVLTSKGQAAMGQDQDDTVILPYTTVQKKILGIQHITQITISADDGVPLDTVTAGIAALLRARHRIGEAPDDFSVRTREIGLRLSVGARDLDVLLQFLVEALVLSLAGGALGVALGFAASWAVSTLMQWSAVVTWAAVLVSFGCAAGIGIFFGLYPARKAAALDPIEALRFE